MEENNSDMGLGLAVLTSHQTAV